MASHMVKLAFACILSVLLVIIIAISIVTLVKVNKTCDKTPATCTSIAQRQSELIAKLIGNFKGENIRENLRSFVEEPHVAGTDGNRRVAEKIAMKWRDAGLEDVHFLTYNVLLSYPNYSNPNRVYVLGSDGSEIFKTTGTTPIVFPDEQSGLDGRAGIQWLGYAADGTVQGEIVYCHYGRIADFDLLESRNISVQGKIALVRYGRLFRGDKATNAQRRGAIAMILFSDPNSVAWFGTDPAHVYPATSHMPGNAVQRGTIMPGNGDPTTPLYPSKNNLYTTKTIEEAKRDGDIPSIPALPIGYFDAYQLLTRMSGDAVPDDWQGGLNVTYRFGPGLNDGQTVRVVVHSTLERRTIQNVIGYIRGSEEPDKYVILGNHYDAWVYGAIDPNGATCVLAEVARAFMQMINETGWRPARSIVFINWDAEEYGLVGSTEFVEEFTEILSKRTIAYLNVDEGVTGNLTIGLNSVPTLYQVSTTAAKFIPNPMQTELSANRTTVYDTWLYNYPNADSDIPWLTDVPDIGLPGGGSDYERFLDYVGIPVAAFDYEGDGDFTLYHSLYETMYLVEHFHDTNNFAVHQAVGQYWATLAFLLVDSPILPLNVTDFAMAVNTIYLRDLSAGIQALPADPLLTDARTQLQNLLTTAQAFLTRCRQFDGEIATVTAQIGCDVNNRRLANGINERLMFVERCFVNPRGAPNANSMRHVLYGENADDAYDSSTLAAVYNQVERTDTPLQGAH